MISLQAYGFRRFAAPISTAAAEMMLAGATAVAVGTANFANPTATIEIINDIRQFMVEQGVQDIQEMIGAVVCTTDGM